MRRSVHATAVCDSFARYDAKKNGCRYYMYVPDVAIYFCMRLTSVHIRYHSFLGVSREVFEHARVAKYHGDTFCARDASSARTPVWYHAFPVLVRVAPQ